MNIPVFRLHEITVDRGYLSHGIRLECNCTFYIEVRNNEGELCTRYILRSRSTGVSNDDVIRKALQNLLNGQIETETEYHDQWGSFPKVDYSKVQFYFDDLDEPWQSLMNQIFIGSNWTIQKNLPKAL